MEFCRDFRCNVIFSMLHRFALFVMWCDKFGRRARRGRERLDAAGLLLLPLSVVAVCCSLHDEGSLGKCLIITPPLPAGIEPSASGCGTVSGLSVLPQHPWPHPRPLSRLTLRRNGCQSKSHGRDGGGERGHAFSPALGPNAG